MLDPGFGFAKHAEHNWELLRRLDEVVALGHRVVVGTSRKTFLGAVGRTADTARPPLERDVVTAATTVHVARHGVWCVRVHDVVATVDALDVVEALHGYGGAAVSGVARDRIRLSGVRGRGFHGVFEHERREGQEFVVDVELAVDLAPAGASDDLADTVNYGAIGAAVLARIEGEPHDLIERLAELVAQDALEHAAVDEVTVTVHKPQAPGRGAVRRRHGHA